ncbi:hypothetical protein HF668_01660 [Acidithiobacillus ferridurans]|uniref:hypothetical protein n=1 Tax=Acidithiobacillus ferridurans TaxID=1232575 RepID=UPI001C07ED57|nr:hypothetical protein [Acidithiobacillus ferridurans]MBU2803889.1 hypothetical protein [Acidithiobacillus ferridurans]
MARTKAQLSAGARLADYLAVGYLAMRYPIGKSGRPWHVKAWKANADGGCPMTY